MPNDNRVLEMLPSLTLEQAEAVEQYVRDCDISEGLADESAREARNEAAVLRLRVADLERALSLANIKLGGIAMLLQGK